MKKLMLSMMFCIGVGLAMMASPAQGCGDDNTVKGDRIQSVTRVLNQERVRILYDRNAVKHDIMKRQATERKAPNCSIEGKKNGRPLGAEDSSNPINPDNPDSVINPDNHLFIVVEKIGKDPFKPGGGTAHGNSLPGLPGKFRDK